MNFALNKALDGSGGSSGQVALTQQSNAVANPADGYIRLVKKRAHLTKIFFWLAVIIPTCIATIFYTVVASPRYVSEARFIVRSVSAPQITGLDVLFRSIGIAKTADDAYIIEKYLLSRDAMNDLIQESVDVKAIFSREEADTLSRYPYFWRTDTQEALYDYYTDHVSVIEDVVKGTIQLKVTAFRPDDAYQVSQALLVLAEKMVNKINARAQADTIDTARQEVSRAEANVIDAQTQLTNYRNSESLLDPSKSAGTALDTIGKLTDDKVSAMAQLKQLKTTAPKNPAIPSLVAKIAALDERIAALQGELAGGDGALASKLDQYEQLVLRRELADKLLTNSLQALDDAMQEARRQHIYVEKVVRPNLPDYSTEPKRVKSILTFFVLGMAIFSIGWVLMVGAGEHLH